MGKNKEKITYIKFIGNKKHWVSTVKDIVERYGFKKVAEPFGGSGVLSVNLMKQDVVDKAIVNDKAFFLHRLGYFLDKEKEIFEKVFEKLGGVKGNKRLNENEKAQVRNILKGVPEDVLLQISEIYVFSGQRITPDLKNVAYFKRMPCFEEYYNFLEHLKRVELKKLDFKEFIDKTEDGTLLIVDPPYLHSLQHAYGEFTFSVSDLLELVYSLLRRGLPFLFFGVKEQNFAKLMALINNPKFEIVEYFEKNMGRGGRKEEAFLVIPHNLKEI